MRRRTKKSHLRKATHDINIVKSFFDKTNDLLKFLTLVFAITGGLISVIGMYKKNEWALIYADYYGFHRALPYNDDNTLGFIIKTFNLVTILIYVLPSLIFVICRKHLNLDRFEIVFSSILSGVGVYLFLLSFDLESFFYDRYPEKYKIIAKSIYFGVSIVVCIITYLILRFIFKNKKRIGTSSMHFDKFRYYYLIGMAAAGLVALFVEYLIFPGYTDPKHVNTYPVVKNSIREDESFDVLIRNLDGERAIFMPASIDKEKNETEGSTEGLKVIKFTKYNYFIDTLDKKDFILTTFDYNEVVENDKNSDLFEILENMNKIDQE